MHGGICISPPYRMNAPIGRIGGKRQLKKRLVGMFPNDYEKMTYVEPFVGAGHVFYAKNPSDKEVINDKDSNIITIHKGLKEFSHDLQGKYKLSRQSFDAWKHKTPKTAKEKFMKDWILSKFSFATGRGSYAPDRGSNGMIMRDYSQRLKDVVILNQDYETVLRKYDSPNTLFYLDPPYEESKRTAHYSHSTFDINHLKSLLDRIKGKFILTFNDGKHIRDLFRGYNITSVKVRYMLPTPHTGSEVIITNF